LPDLVGLSCPAVVHAGNQHGRRRGQSSLTQPALQGARVRDELAGIHLEQVDADTPASPAGMGTSQLQARLAYRQANVGHLATAQVGQRRKIVSVGQVAPLLQQIANGADRYRKLLGDL
jgi:hypothetical protein